MRSAFKIYPWSGHYSQLPTWSMPPSLLAWILAAASLLVSLLSSLPLYSWLSVRIASVYFVTPKGHHFTCLFTTLRCPFTSLKGKVKFFRMAYMALKELTSPSVLTSSGTTLPFTPSAPVRIKWFLRQDQALAVISPGSVPAMDPHQAPSLPPSSLCSNIIFSMRSHENT